MNRKALEKMVAAGKASIEQAEKKAAKEAFWNEKVQCFLCSKQVPRKATVLLPDIRKPACKTHAGVKG